MPTHPTASPAEGSAETKHTPGPWSVPHFARPDVDCECGYVLTEEHFGAVCTVHASGEGDWRKTGDNPKFDQACANARLIAAAPELLAALETAYAICGDIRNQWPNRDSEFGQGSLNAMLDAICKATGREHQDAQDDFCSRLAVAAHRQPT